MSKIETRHLPITAMIGALTVNAHGEEFHVIDVTVDPDNGEVWLWLKDTHSQVGVKWNDWIPQHGATLMPKGMGGGG